jgi:hypothetical protein
MRNITAANGAIGTDKQWILQGKTQAGVGWVKMGMETDDRSGFPNAP